MKIVQAITRSDTVGGAQIHVRDLCLALMKNNHEVTVLVGGEGAFTQELRDRGIAYRSLHNLVRPISPVRDWVAVFEMRAVLKELAPQLVCTHSSKAGWVGRIAGYSLGIPTTFTAHGWAFTDGVQPLARRLYVFAEKLAAPMAAGIITVSNYDWQLAFSHRIASGVKMTTVHNGVPDIPLSLRAVPAKDPVRIIMVARFESPKDHTALIRALEPLRDLPWELVLVGDGPLQTQIEGLVRKLGLADRVHFLGVRQDVTELLCQGQIFVLSSNWEGLPLSILEAMRSGLPVVASDVGGVRELIQDGHNGFLITRGDHNNFCAKLQELIEHPSLRERMGCRGRQLYEERFTLEAMVCKTMRVYDEVLFRPQ